MPLPSAAHDFTLPTGIPFLAEYVIERMLERGDDWALYFARHATRPTERFRIRVVRSETVLHPDGVDPVLSRAARLARIEHPGIVPYVTSGLDPDRGLVAVVSRHLLGITLRERFERGGRKLTTAEIARLVCEVGDALDCLHELHPPLVHARLDASRVLLAAPDAGVRLLGLEESIDEGARPARDQFALASIAYECLTGREAFVSGEPTASEPLPRLERIDAPIGTLADLEWVLHRAWAADESRRFASAGRLAAEIARLLGANDAMTTARARRTERTNARGGSGTQRAVRPPTLPPTTRTTSDTRAAVPRPSAPHTPSSGERPVILPNAGRYAVHNGRSQTQRVQVDASAIGTPKSPPPLPRTRSTASPPPGVVRTPTLVGTPVAAAPRAALVTAPEAGADRASHVVARGDGDDADLSFHLDVDSIEPARDAVSPRAAIAPPLVAMPIPPSEPLVVAPAVDVRSAPQPIVPLAANDATASAVAAPTTRSEPPVASAFMSAILDARASAPLAAEPVIEVDPFPSIPPRAVPIPLVSPSRARAESDRTPPRRRDRVRPRGRRFVHLVGAIGLALVFGGADRIAPHVPAMRRWVAQWIAPPRAIGHVQIPALAPATPTPVAQPEVTHTAVTASPIAAVPTAQERARATAAWRAVIDDCAARVGRDHRHARFTVTYAGETGLATSVMFPDTFFRTHRIGTCIAEAASRVRIEPFTNTQWTTSYSILVP
jgi:hypothetical protein